MAARAKLVLPLLQQALHRAKQLIADDQLFFPFSLMTCPSGNIQPVDSSNEQLNPNLRETYRHLENTIMAGVMAGKILAVAIAVDITIPEGQPSQHQDAIRILVEAQGYARYFYLPYRRQSSSGINVKKQQGVKTIFGDCFSVECSPKYFTSQPILSSPAMMH